MKIIIIVAMASNRIIGNQNQLIWHLPNDLKRFKRLTVGSVVVMGRKTFESISRPLPQRENIVLTRQQDWKRDGVTVFQSKQQVLDYIKEKEKVFIIGGSEIYRLFLDDADTLEITHVNTTTLGDTIFPAIDYQKWTLISEFSYEKDEKHVFSYKFATYNRKSD